jgi:two-component system, LuxR family, response regulator FixJ
MNTRSQTVYIIDDDQAIVDSLLILLSSEGLEAKAFTSAKAFLKICEPSMRGCILLDIRMPEMSGIELQTWLLENDINIPVIFLTGSGDIPLSSQAFRSGALDFLEKPFDIEKLLERIHEAFARDSEQWHTHYRKNLLKESCARLTPREREILKWVSAGYSSKEIAKVIGISNRTIEVHRSHIMEKLKAKSLAELISIAMELEEGA